MSNPTFNPGEYSQQPDVRITSSDRTEMEAALQQHVYGQRVTRIVLVRQPDGVASRRYGKLAEYVEVQVHLENGITYLMRVTTEFGKVLSSGDGLSREETP